MDYQEAAERLAALAICTEVVPVGCEQCPAYQEGEDREKQQKACNDMMEPEKIEARIQALQVTQEIVGQNTRFQENLLRRFSCGVFLFGSTCKGHLLCACKPAGNNHIGGIHH